MATALAADSYTFNHGRAAFHGTSAVDQAEPHLDVFELCALSTDILKASVPQSGTPRCPDGEAAATSYWGAHDGTPPIVIPPQLVVRESTGPVGSGALH